MTRIHGHAAALLSALVAALAACNNSNPAETVSATESFPVTSSWTATAAPVGTSTVKTATLAVKQHAGFRAETAITITGAPNTTYQWRIFKGDCSVTAAASNATANNGTWEFATAQAYTDVTTNASGTGTVNPTVAGALDSATAYSVRVRPGQASITWHGNAPIACGNLQRN